MNPEKLLPPRTLDKRENRQTTTQPQRNKKRKGYKATKDTEPGHRTRRRDKVKEQGEERYRGCWRHRGF